MSQGWGGARGAFRDGYVCHGNLDEVIDSCSRRSIPKKNGLTTS